MNYADEWQTAYEQQHGRKPSELSMRIARHNDKVGESLQKLGKKDAQEGRDPIPGAEFLKLAQKAFKSVPDLPFDFFLTVADEWRSDYLEGYEKGGTK